MVNEQKARVVKEFESLFNNHSVIGVLNMHGMPARQLREIRNALRKVAKIKTAKLTLIRIAMKNVSKPGLDTLGQYVTKETALLFSNENPFKLYRIIESNKSPAKAKPGDVTPIDVVIPAGPTPFAAGPIIGEFQRAKIKTSVEGGKISVKEDAVVARAGTKMTRELCDFISKFGIEPMEIQLDLKVALDNGTVFAKDVLSVPREKYISDIVRTYHGAVGLAVAAGIINRETVRRLLRKAQRGARALAIEHGIFEKEVMGAVLAKAKHAAEAIKKRVG